MSIWEARRQDRENISQPPVQLHLLTKHTSQNMAGKEKLQAVEQQLQYYIITTMREEDGEATTLCQACTSTYAHTNTHLMGTTWLDQNKAFGDALFPAELIFLKRAQSDGLVSRRFRHVEHYKQILPDNSSFSCSFLALLCRRHSGNIILFIDVKAFQ